MPTIETIAIAYAVIVVIGALAAVEMLYRRFDH